MDTWTKTSLTSSGVRSLTVVLNRPPRETEATSATQSDSALAAADPLEASDATDTQAEQPDARAAANDRLARVAHGAEFGHQFCAVKQSQPPAARFSADPWRLWKVATTSSANSGSLMLWGVRISWR